MTEINRKTTQPLSQEDLQLRSSLTVHQARAELARIIAAIHELQRWLEDGWATHERVWGPELDATVRSAVLRALGRER